MTTQEFNDLMRRLENVAQMMNGFRLSRRPFFTDAELLENEKRFRAEVEMPDQIQLGAMQ